MRIIKILMESIDMRANANEKNRYQNHPPVDYCMQRTQGRLTRLVLAALFLLVGALFGVGFLAMLWEDRSDWGLENYAVLIFAGLLCAGFVISSVYEAYTSLRDGLFPEKSCLAKSIRSQLPYPESAPDVKELFAMVNRDIGQNGQWFDRIAVGKEWVLGDEVSAISRIRVVFGRNEIVRHHTQRGTQSTRVVELYIMDDRHQVQASSLRDLRELEPLMECLALRAPDALFLSYDEFTKYNVMEEDEWQKVLQDYRRRKGQREATQYQYSDEMQQNMILTRSDGSVPSRVDGEELLKLLNQPSGAFTLTAGKPVIVGEHIFTEMRCIPDGRGGFELLLKEAAGEPDAPFYCGGRKYAGREETRSILERWMCGQVPDPGTFAAVRIPGNTAKEPEPRVRQEQSEAELTLVSAQGVCERHRRFTREDIQIAADRIVDGSCRTVELVPERKCGFEWMCVTAGDERDGRCTVRTVDPATLHFFEIKCTHRQAAAWLMEFADGRFHPDWSGWKDYTKKVWKDAGKGTK